MGRCFEEEMFYVTSFISFSSNGALDWWAVAFITMMETTSKEYFVCFSYQIQLQGNNTTAATEMDKEDLL